MYVYMHVCNGVTVKVIQCALVDNDILTKIVSYPTLAGCISISLSPSLSFSLSLSLSLSIDIHNMYVCMYIYIYIYIYIYTYVRMCYIQVGWLWLLALSPGWQSVLSSGGPTKANAPCRYGARLPIQERRKCALRRSILLVTCFVNKYCVVLGISGSYQTLAYHLNEHLNA